MSDSVLAAVFMGLTVALFIAHALARRSAPAADCTSAAVGGQTDPEPAGGSREFTPLTDPNAWQSATVFDLAEAEALLDRAEREGYRERELVVLGHSTFLVRWRGLS